MAPHVCTLLFKPQREDWVQLASSRWCAVTAQLPRVCCSAVARPGSASDAFASAYALAPRGCVQVQATAGLCVAWCFTPGAQIKGVGFDDFVKDRRVAAGVPPKGVGRRKVEPTCFDAFMKNDAVAAGTAPRGPVTDFDRFLKRHVTSAAQLASANAMASSAPVVDELDAVAAVEVLVLYGTEYGFAREIATKVAAALRGSRIRAVVKDMAEVPCGLPLAAGTDGAAQAALFICSTHGDGVPPPEARDFFDWLASDAAPKLAHLPYSVCALGDTSYTHFCKAGRSLDARLLALGGAASTPRVDVNREDWVAVDAWIAAAVDALVALKLPPHAPRSPNGSASTGAPAVPLPHGKSRPFGATLVAKQGLCVLDGPDDKDTVRLEFDISGSGLDYLPGDALGVFPTNDAPEVARLLSALGAHGGEMVPAPTWRLPGAAATLSLRDALSACYDLRDPRPTLLSWLAERATQADDRAALSLLLEHGTDSSRNKPLAAFLEQRHVSDVLVAVRSVPVTWQDVLPHLRQLQPRLYSISSSPLERASHVSVTVAVVRYTALFVPRVGVASTFLAERLAVGSTAPVYIAKNPDFRLPASMAVPIIMVGPGTGLAPFRAFIMHRQHSAAPEANGEAVLYFGCRHRAKDFLYGEALEAWAAQGALTLHTAFSRDGPDKVYVQQRVAETADALFSLLSVGAHFYVCGDANAMAGDVDKALRALLAARLPSGAADVDAYVAGLEASGRYQRDVWFS